MLLGWLGFSVFFGFTMLQQLGLSERNLLRAGDTGDTDTDCRGHASSGWVSLHDRPAMRKRILRRWLLPRFAGR
jgi:hypothetical protein